MCHISEDMVVVQKLFEMKGQAVKNIQIPGNTHIKAQKLAMSAL